MRICKSLLLILVSIYFFQISLFANGQQESKDSKAFRKLEFGDSPEVVEKKLQDDAKFNRYDIGFDFDVPIGRGRIKVGAYKYFLVPYFYDNKLYRIVLRSPSRSARYVNTEIKDWWQNLIDVISKKYGEKIGRDFNIFNLDPGYVRFTHNWEYKNKAIRIGIGERPIDYEYYACVWIEDSNVVRLIKEKNRKKEDLKKATSSEDF